MALYPLNPSSGIRSPRSGELAGDDWFASQGAPSGGGAAGIMAPPRSAEDQRLLQDPAFRAQYGAWVNAQGPGAADWATPTGYQQWLQQQGAPQMTGGPAARAPMPAGAPSGQPPTDRAGIVQWVTQHLGQYGIQPGARGSGVGDVEYWADQILDPVNTGYGDWAGRMQRGVQGTQPPLPGAGGGGAMGGGVGGAFGTGVDYEAIRRLLGPGGAAELQQSPGYQFRLGEGVKALEKSAAAKGTLLTGGTLKGLQRYAQDFASNAYGNRLAQLTGLANLDLGAQQQRYGQLLGVSQLGLNAAGQQGVLGSQYAGLAGSLLGGQAANVSDLLTGRGNAQAAGTVGGANAWQQGLSGASNNALQTILLSQMMNRGIQTPGSPDYSWTANLAPGQYGPVRT